jgi:hypothetical protein
MKNKPAEPVPTVTLYTGEVVPKYWVCLRTIWYLPSQCIDDRIRRGEILEVDRYEFHSFGMKPDELAFKEHSSRYGPFRRVNFAPLTARQIKNRNLK